MKNIDVIKDIAYSKIRESLSLYDQGLKDKGNKKLILPSKDLRRLPSQIESFI
jgi:hypothetical protein